MITVSTCLWDPTPESMEFSRCYDESWVEKLYRGFQRNLTQPFKFVVFTDRPRTFKEPIEQMLLERRPIGYGSCVEPFKLNEAMIFVGLDTVIVRNIDKLARWCLSGKGENLALPKHPYEDWSINGVVLVKAGQRHIFDEWTGQNDMKWMRSFPHGRIDELWPDRVVSYKGSVAKQGLARSVKIVYFHGKPKMNTLTTDSWVSENWR